MSKILIKKNKGESFESMFRRFKNRERSSGKQLTIKSGRFHSKGLTKNKRKESALRRIMKTENIAYLLRSGKITEQELRGRGRRRR